MTASTTVFRETRAKVILPRVDGDESLTAKGHSMALVEWKPGDWINTSLVNRVTYKREEKPVSTADAAAFIHKATHGKPRLEIVETLTVYLTIVVEPHGGPITITDPSDISRLATLLGITLPSPEPSA